MAAPRGSGDRLGRPRLCAEWPCWRGSQWPCGSGPLSFTGRGSRLRSPSQQACSEGQRWSLFAPATELGVELGLVWRNRGASCGPCVGATVGAHCPCQPWPGQCTGPGDADCSDDKACCPCVAGTGDWVSSWHCPSSSDPLLSAPRTKVLTCSGRPGRCWGLSCDADVLAQLAALCQGLRPEPSLRDPGRCFPRTVSTFMLACPWVPEPACVFGRCPCR